MNAISLRSVTKHFRGPAGKVTALDDVTLDVSSGEFVVIVGHNGSGKSTLLNLVAGRDTPDEGWISIDSSGDKAGDRKGAIAFAVVQDPRRGTADDLSVWEHLLLAGLRGMPRPFGGTNGAGLSHLSTGGASGLGAKMDSDAETLSGGQRQLLSLEMAVSRRASLILLDEPTASLDRTNASYCLSQIERMKSELGATILLVTHDLVAASRIGERLIVLVDGKVKCDMKEDKRELSAEDIFRLVEIGRAPDY